MSRNPIRAMSLDEFIELALDSGLPFEPSDFPELISRGVLFPLNGYEPMYCPLQLFGLKRYIDDVQYLRHPWLGPAQHPDLERSRRLAARLVSIASQLRGDVGAAPDRAAILEIAEEIAEDLAGEDPFGPLYEIIDVLHEHVIERLSGRTRLWAELTCVARALVEFASQDEFVPPAPVAQPAPVVSEPVGRTATTVKQVVASERESVEYRNTEVTSPQVPAVAADEPAQSAEELARQIRQSAEFQAAEVTAPELGVPASLQQGGSIEQLAEPAAPAVDDARVTAQMDTIEPEDDTPVPTQPVPEAEPEPIASAVELPKPSFKDRLDSLRISGEAPALKKPSSLGAKAIALSVSKKTGLEGESSVVEEAPEGAVAAPAPTPDAGIFDDSEQTSLLEPSAGSHVEDDGTLAQRIHELNAKRESYMKEQNWHGLIALYEDGISLFEATERQQVHLTLAKLYELKLGDSMSAFSNLSAAFELGGDEGILTRILEAMERSNDASTGERISAWCGEVLEDMHLESAARAGLQRLRSMGLSAAGMPERAFLMYASYLSDRAEERLSAQALDTLEHVAEGSSEEDVLAVYDDLLEELTQSHLLALVSSRAGKFAMSAGQNERAIGYLEIASYHDSEDEQVFHLLVYLYEAQGMASELVMLFERRFAREPGSREELADGWRAAKEAELGDPERAIAYYEGVLERVSDDRVALDALMDVYQGTARHGEGYAFLNRHVQAMTRAEARVGALVRLAAIAQNNLYAPEEAVVHYEAAIDLVGPRKDLLCVLAVLRLEVGEWLDALAVLDALTTPGDFELTDDEVVRWSMEGARVAHRLQRMDDVSRLVHRVLQVAPDDADANQLLATLG